MTIPLRRPRATRLLTVTLGLALAVTGAAACGSSTESSDSTTGATSGPEVPDTETTTATTTATTADTEAPADTEAASDTTGATDTDGTLIEATVAGGAVEVSSERIAVPLGNEVSIVVETDVAEPVHLHGYDIEVDAAPGAPARIDFTADVPGVFEVELEDSGTFLFEIEVS